jgi:hypothetical protein
MRLRGPVPLQLEREEAGMADVIFLAVGAAAFIAFAALAAALKRV